MTSSGPEQTPSGSEPTPDPAAPAAPASRGGRRVQPADHGVAAGTLGYLVCLIVPWFSVDGFDLGSGYRLPAVSVNGFDSGVLTFALVLLLLASAWALLPALADVPVPFPRVFLTAGLAAVAFVLTLIEWLATFDIGFTLVGLLAFLASVAVLGAAVLRLLPDLRSGSLPGGPGAGT